MLKSITALHLNNIKTGSFGDKRAVFKGFTGNGFIFENCTNMTIDGIIVSGTGWNKNDSGIGIFIEKCKNLKLLNSDVSGIYFNCRREKNYVRKKL
jgi:nitrous oxidase accessory protein NosD